MQRIKTDEEKRLEPDEPVAVAICHECGCEIYGSEIYGMDDMVNAICRNCLEEEWSRLQPWEKFEILGYRVVT